MPNDGRLVPGMFVTVEVYYGQGRSRVTLEFSGGVSLDEAANDVQSALDRLRDDLPVEAEAPTIWKFDPDPQDIVSLAAQSSRGLSATTRLLERETARRFEQLLVPGGSSSSSACCGRASARRSRRATCITPPAPPSRGSPGSSATVPG